MEFVKSMLGLLLLCISIGAIASIGIFLLDVIKWHEREKRVTVTPSKEPVAKKDYTESEVSNVGDDDGKYNTSAFLGSGL